MGRSSYVFIANVDGTVLSRVNVDQYGMFLFLMAAYGSI